MRKHLVWIIAAALALAVSVAGVASATDSTGTDYSQLKMTVSPTKLSKKKFKPVKKLFVETSTLNNSNPGTPTAPGSSPAPTTKVVLTFDKNIKFTSKGLKQCDKNNPAIVNGDTTTARQACKSSMVGSGTATACVVGSAVNVPCAGQTFLQTVSAFNGKPKGGKPTIVLHSWSAALPVPTVLVGTLDTKKNKLTVPIPSAVYKLATITDFKTKVGKSYKSKGKKYNYVTAKCPHKKLTLKGTFSYLGDPSDTVSAPPAKCSG